MFPWQLCIYIILIPMSAKVKNQLIQSLKIWIAIYPAITLIMLLFGRQLAALPIYLRTLVLTLILVPLMVFVLLPIVNALSKRLLMSPE